MLLYNFLIFKDWENWNHKENIVKGYSYFLSKEEISAPTEVYYQSQEKEWDCRTSRITAASLRKNCSEKNPEVNI